MTPITAGTATSPTDIGLPGAAEALDRRLDPNAERPIAVAFSGGGDSLAALIAACAWAGPRRRVVAITVDHRLQAQSAVWTRLAQDAANRFGADFTVCAWEGEKPATGLPAAARAARHRLIAEAARAAGARVIVFGHTADDRLESALMRAEGSTLGSLREWGPSPAWPEGRGLFIVRPLLGLRREAIRTALRAAGETWIDDPANADLRYARPRARARLNGPEGAAAPPLADQDLVEQVLAGLARTARLDAAGFIRLDRRALCAAPEPAARRLLAAAVVSVGGGDRLPRGGRLAGLVQRLRDAGALVATLSGAQVSADPSQVLIARDAGRARRSGPSPLRLLQGQTAVWDGRFEITTKTAAVEVDLLAGRAARLAVDERHALKAVPAPARGGLLALVEAFHRPRCPLLASVDGIEVRSLVPERFLAACGAIAWEGAAEVR